MAKYLILLVAMAATFSVVDSAAAGHRRRGGCAGGNCHVGHHHGGYYGGGCAGGVCGAPVYDGGYAVNAVDSAPVVAEAPVVIRPQPAPRYTSVRRGLFGWRRY
jgi:hypothetical protein